jgi:hypothetical protein
MPHYTPLDSLKEIAVRSHLTLANAVNVLETPDALGLPDAIAILTNELAQLHDIIFEAVAAHVDDIEPESCRSFAMTTT